MRVRLTRTVAGFLALATALLAACGAPPGQDAGGSPDGTPPATTARPTTVSAQAPGELAGTRWRLTSLNGRGPAAGTEITLRVRGDEIRGNGGCNFYRAERLDTAAGAFRVGPVSATEMACKGPAGEQEGEYLEALRVAETYRSAGGRLEIRDASGGAVLVFEEERA